MLDGKGFEIFVQDGQKVKRGQLLMKFDLDYIRANAASDACMAVFIRPVRGTVGAHGARRTGERIG